MFSRVFLFALAVSLLLLQPFVISAAENSQIAATAGWAEVDITPPLGIGLGGRGGPGTLASKILDPLVAQVLYLKDGKETGFVLVSFDLIGLPHDLSDRIRSDIVHELGVEWNLVVLNTSHTHSGPYMIRSLMAGVGPAPQIEIDYFKALEDKVISAARAARRALQPVEATVYRGEARIGINRRGKDPSGRGGIIPDANAPYDDQLWVLRLAPTNNQPTAVIFSTACHPVIVYGYALAAISADFPGVARKELRALLGPRTHAQFVQGFAGDIRPRILADLEKGRFRKSESEDLQAAGQELAFAVMAARKSAGQPLALDIAGAADRPFLPRGQPPPCEFYEKLRADALAKTNQFLVGVSDYWLARYDTGDGFARGDEWSLGLIRLAENEWIVHSAGEPCIEWRAKIAAWLAPLNLVAWGYSQEGRSYLPTEAMLPEGGYEVLESNQARASTPAPFAPGIEAAVRDSLIRQLAHIRAKK